MFDIHLSQGEHTATVKFTGELDYSVIEACLPVMAEAKTLKAKTYVADVAGLTAIDSSGLGVLISLRNAAMKAGGTLHIRGAQGQVAETLKMTRFDILATID